MALDRGARFIVPLRATRGGKCVSRRSSNSVLSEKEKKKEQKEKDSFGLGMGRGMDGMENSERR